MQILSEEAQAVRAYKGYEKGEVVVESLCDDLLHVSFGEQIAVRRDLAEMIAGGFEREKPGEDEEIDLGLEELKKRNDPIRRTMHLTMGLQVGLNVKETTLMCPGKLYDMYDIYKEVHSLKERSIDD